MEPYYLGSILQPLILGSFHMTVCAKYLEVGLKYCAQQESKFITGPVV